MHDPESPKATSLPVDSATFSPPMPPSHATRVTGAEEVRHSQLVPDDSDEPYDLVGIGFGPANLALAIALHDAIDARTPIPGLEHIRNRKPRVLFLERQPYFAWHEGMLLPGTKMQITFVKDLATLRDPRSNFTFLNYLHDKDRLVHFTNLDTFLPQRLEYQDYMKWCASHFANVVSYGTEAIDISPISHQGGAATGFSISVKDVKTAATHIVRARHTVIAVGGWPSIPKALPQDHPRVLHSSRYAMRIGQALPNSSAAYKIAVIGSGQSAAEIFNDLHSRYPNAHSRLFIRGAALRPSDDSPFVNEIFDPARVDSFYGQCIDQRTRSLQQDKATNYGVVRIGLLEHIYETMYTQRVREPDEVRWQHRIVANTTLDSAEALPKAVRLHLRNTTTSETSCFEFDAIIVAAGYQRDVHETMLGPCRDLMTEQAREQQKCEVHRDYSVDFEQGKIEPTAGVWLQGCNESTHGVSLISHCFGIDITTNDNLQLSDTLLSILATRGGELVKSIFGDDRF